MITEQEKKLIHLTGELWNEFTLLPVEHPDDTDDFRFHIHAIQNMILARCSIRDNYTKVEFPADRSTKNMDTV